MPDVKATRYDVRQAERAFNVHCSQHHCKTGDRCAERLRLWEAQMQTALHWNEPAKAL